RFPTRRSSDLFVVFDIYRSLLEDALRYHRKNDKKKLFLPKIGTKKLRVTTLVNSITVHSFIDNGTSPEYIQLTMCISPSALVWFTSATRFLISRNKSYWK